MPNPPMTPHQARAHWTRVGLLKTGTVKTLTEFKAFNRLWSLNYTPEGWCDISHNGNMLTYSFVLQKKTAPDGICFHRLILGNLSLYWGRVDQAPKFEVQL